MKNIINHKNDCLPAKRKTKLIAPIIGFECLNCGARKYFIEDIDKHLKNIEDLCGDKYFFNKENPNYEDNMERVKQLIMEIKNAP